jgi:hypothetical protein
MHCTIFYLTRPRTCTCSHSYHPYHLIPSLASNVSCRFALVACAKSEIGLHQMPWCKTRSRRARKGITTLSRASNQIVGQPYILFSHQFSHPNHSTPSYFGKKSEQYGIRKLGNVGIDSEVRLERPKTNNTSLHMSPVSKFCANRAKPRSHDTLLPSEAAQKTLSDKASTPTCMQ